MPRSCAISLTPSFACRVLPRWLPVCRSGCVKTPTTSCGLPRRAANVGSANEPVPIITSRMAILPKSLNHRDTEAQRRQERRRTADGIQTWVRYRALLLSSLCLCVSVVQIFFSGAFERCQQLFDLDVRRDLALFLSPAELALEALDRAAAR